MKDESDRPQSEMDVLKFYVWLMLVMTVVLAGLFWYVWNELDATRTNLQVGQKAAKDFADQQAAIQGMMKVYTNNKEDAARDAPNSWFSAIWTRKGINTNSMQPGAWKFPPDYNAKGRYSEERIDMGFNAKAPLPRQSIVEFCHEIEKSSTRLRILELDITRVDKENFDKDEWSGKVTVGYRHTPEKSD